MNRRVDIDSLRQEIGALDDHSFTELQQRFQLLHRIAPPKRIGRKLLILAIAYELQRKAYGIRVDRVRARVLEFNTDRIARLGLSRSTKNTVRKTMKPGGRLVREWRGRQYEVYVADDGCYLEGTRYSSLSSAAEAITGVKRNGPAFFGLRSSRVNP